MDKKEQLSFLLCFLKETETEVKKDMLEDKQVMIEKAINLRLMCDYVVSCSYLDIVLIVNMLHDYINMLDEIKADNIDYQVYYREKLLKLADGLAQQIEYDYEKQLEKCKKKMAAKETNSDVGEDALSLTVKRGKK